MMTILIPILIAAYWLIIAALFGIAEGYYFYHLNQAYDKRGRKHDHAFLTLIRALIALPLIICLFIQFWFVATTLMLLFMICAFPYIHDGMYYATRNQLHKGTYPDGWRTSTDGRAVFDIDYSTRVVMFFAAMLFLIAIIIHKFI